MAKLPKIFLISSLVCLVFGLSDIASPALNGLGRGVGAVLFVLFYIFNLLDKESSKYEAEFYSQDAVADKKIASVNADLPRKGKAAA